MSAALSAEKALGLLRAAFDQAREKGYRPMGVVVLDAAGQLVAAGREPGASALRLDIAQGKAAAAVGMGASSRVLAQRAADMPVFFGTIAAASQQKFIPQTGALLFKGADGQLLGAIGASGGTGDEDEHICAVALQAAGLLAG